ncbi:MAG: DNRLRE domain-containing protein, partial [Limisphaerales bacterium]
MRKCLIWTFLHICIAGFGQAATSELILQQGLSGYTGVHDTYISRATWGNPPQFSVNYGQNTSLVLGRDATDSPLLRFDLSQIPPNSTIYSATLHLYGTSQSTSPAGGTMPRRIQTFRVLKPWVEGNQVATPITASGRFGTTGDHAVQYFSGEGTSVPWASRGMLDGTDFHGEPVGFTDVLNPAWYSWDITLLVHDWVRGKFPNHGVTLRDATGYQAGNNDMRAFHSSQATANSALRPKLVIVYNPDTPQPNAGQDLVRYDWSGEAILLDGSGSVDAPSGSTATLQYEWKVKSAGFASGITNGSLIGNAAQTSFTPDVPGDWVLLLKVTNEQGEQAFDEVFLRLWSIPNGRPRIYLTEAKLNTLKQRAANNDPRWVQLLNNAQLVNGEMKNKALAWLVSEQPQFADQAIQMALTRITNATENSTKAADLALVYDWCHARLTPAQSNA